jgi:hypothetical protein
MRYELSHKEWSIFGQCSRPGRAVYPASTTGASSMASSGVSRSGAPVFLRWRRAGTWDGIMQALTVARDGAVQMIDASMVRVPTSMRPLSPTAATKA